jgi:hypothetical protein
MIEAVERYRAAYRSAETLRAGGDHRTARRRGVARDLHAGLRDEEYVGDASSCRVATSPRGAP